MLEHIYPLLRFLPAVIALTLSQPLAAQIPAEGAGAPPIAVTSPLQDLESRSATGDATATRQLGEWYQRGVNGAPDLAAAARYYEIAAKRGDAEAQYNLGNMFLLGEGVAEDRNAALNYYRLAAAQGHQLAMRNLNEMLRVRGGAGSSAAGAVGAQATLDADAQAALALAQRHGIVVRFGSQTPAAGSVTPQQAAPSAALPALPPLSTAPQENTKVSQPPPVAAVTTPAPVVPRAASPDQTATQLAHALEALAARDFARGIKLLEPLAVAGHAEAQYQLAQLHDQGNGVALDPAQAITWYREAARRRHPGALARLQEIYRNEGLPMPALTPAPMQQAPSDPQSVKPRASP